MLRILYEEHKKWGLEVIRIKQVDKFKYLGTIVDRNGISNQEIKYKIKKVRNVIGTLNVWWDKNIKDRIKKRIGQKMVVTDLTYGFELWTIKEEDKRISNAVEIDYLRRIRRTSRLERVQNEQIRSKMKAKETMIDRIEKKSLKLFGHLLRME